MAIVVTLVALAMLVVSSLVSDMAGYLDGYATEDDAHLLERPSRRVPQPLAISAGRDHRADQMAALYISSR